MILIFIFAWTSSISYGSKLERWTDPNVEGSIQPNALADASRQPKLFFEVRIISSIKESHSLKNYYHSLDNIIYLSFANSAHVIRVFYCPPHIL